MNSPRQKLARIRPPGKTGAGNRARLRGRSRIDVFSLPIVVRQSETPADMQQLAGALEELARFALMNASPTAQCPDGDAGEADSLCRQGNRPVNAEPYQAQAGVQGAYDEQ